jgi:hypothetical protein
VIVVLALCLCLGPLVGASACLALPALLGVDVFGVSSGLLAVVVVLAALQLAASSGVSAVYRWCFVRPAVRGASLWAALCVSLVALTYQPIIQPLAALATDTRPVAALLDSLFELLVASFTCVGVAIIGCMMAVVLVELPLRWVQGDKLFLSDGAFRFLRSMGVGVMLVAGSVAMQERGVSLLVDSLKRLVG